jgi:hypothetical protein
VSGVRAQLAAAELSLRLGALLRGLRAAVDRRDRRTAALDRPDLAHLAITRQHARVVLDEAAAFAGGGRAYGPGTSLLPAERARLDDLGAQATAAGFQLPGTLLRERGLAELDVEILLLAAAPALDPSFAALYGFLNDTRSCLSATPYLAVEVLAVDSDNERQVLTACGAFGALRSGGWLVATGVDRSALTSLRVADGVLELLSGASVDSRLLGRPAAPVEHRPLPAGVDPDVVAALGQALRLGRIDVVGVWGTRRSGRSAVVAALVSGRPALRTGPDGVDVALQQAALSGGVCVVDVPDDTDQAAGLADHMAVSTVPVVMVGAEPLRAPSLIRDRRYAELTMPAPGFADRRATWSAAFPQIDAPGVADLAARFRLLPDEVEAVASMDLATSGWATNSDRPTVGAIAGLVSRRRSPQVATIRAPRRGPDLLVLPAAELAQVREVAAAARAWPRVTEAWRLERFGNPGVTALFAGDPGTGKTLAAEVIAADVGLDLMVVDLSRLVSKWIGETEKHLDAVFDEAEASNCVLFFDEADSVFGQRGEVTRGADRYANLEVGYLLQRLERFEGLVILASNLRANLDSAFTRRFHHVVHFPRPAEPERRRLWELALGPPVQLAEPVDVALLAALDLTGAGIAAIVRSAALAVPDGPAPLTVAGLVAATSKQFQREARLLPREQIGPYARFL